MQYYLIQHETQRALSFNLPQSAYLHIRYCNMHVEYFFSCCCYMYKYWAPRFLSFSLDPLLLFLCCESISHVHIIMYAMHARNATFGKEEEEEERKSGAQVKENTVYLQRQWFSAYHSVVNDAIVPTVVFNITYAVVHVLQLPYSSTCTVVQYVQ